MKHLKSYSVVIYILPLLALIYSNSAFPETTEKRMVIGDTSESIVITTDDSIEIDIKGHIITFTGNVEAVRDDINIKCQKIELFYENPSDSNDPGKAQLIEIIATENVMISQHDPDEGDDITATTEKAIYNQKDQKLVLTGNPVVKQGTNFLEGSKITLFLKEGELDKITVEGSKEDKAKASINQKEETR